MSRLWSSLQKDDFLRCKRSSDGEHGADSCGWSSLNLRRGGSAGASNCSRGNKASAQLLMAPLGGMRISLDSICCCCILHPRQPQVLTKKLLGRSCDLTVRRVEMIFGKALSSSCRRRASSSSVSCVSLAGDGLSLRFLASTASAADTNPTLVRWRLLYWSDRPER